MYIFIYVLISCQIFIHTHLFYVTELPPMQETHLCPDHWGDSNCGQNSDYCPFGLVTCHRNSNQVMNNKLNLKWHPHPKKSKMAAAAILMLFLFGIMVNLYVGLQTESRHRILFKYRPMQQQTSYG